MSENSNDSKIALALFESIKDNAKKAEKDKSDPNRSGVGRSRALGKHRAYTECFDLIDLLLKSSNDNAVKAKLLADLSIVIDDREIAIKKLADVFVYADKVCMLKEMIKPADLQREIEEPLQFVMDMLNFPTLKKNAWIEEALKLFPNARQMTAEESADYEASLDKLYQPTGRNMFDAKPTDELTIRVGPYTANSTLILSSYPLNTGETIDVLDINVECSAFKRSLLVECNDFKFYCDRDELEAFLKTSAIVEAIEKTNAHEEEVHILKNVFLYLNKLKGFPFGEVHLNIVKAKLQSVINRLDKNPIDLSKLILESEEKSDYADEYLARQTIYFEDEFGETQLLERMKKMIIHNPNHSDRKMRVSIGTDSFTCSKALIDSYIEAKALVPYITKAEDRMSTTFRVEKKVACSDGRDTVILEAGDKLVVLDWQVPGVIRIHRINDREYLFARNEFEGNVSAGLIKAEKF